MGRMLRPYTVSSSEPHFVFNSIKQVLRKIFVPESYADSSLVLMSSIIISGLGALLAMARDDTGFSDKTLILGLGGGFVVFLATFGTKIVLLKEFFESGASINPYGIGFAALLVGLFSGLTNRALESMANGIANRLIKP